jgi:hypothetical protein
LRNADVTVEQLKRLVEIQTEVVKQAEQIEQTKKSRRTGPRKLVAAPRRLLSFLSQLW